MDSAVVQYCDSFYSLRYERVWVKSLCNDCMGNVYFTRKYHDQLTIEIRKACYSNQISLSEYFFCLLLVSGTLFIDTAFCLLSWLRHNISTNKLLCSFCYPFYNSTKVSGVLLVLSDILTLRSMQIILSRVLGRIPHIRCPRWMLHA